MDLVTFHYLKGTFKYSPPHTDTCVVLLRVSGSLITKENKENNHTKSQVDFIFKLFRRVDEAPHKQSLEEASGAHIPGLHNTQRVGHVGDMLG